MYRFFLLYTEISSTFFLNIIFIFIFLVISPLTFQLLLDDFGLNCERQHARHFSTFMLWINQQWSPPCVFISLHSSIFFFLCNTKQKSSSCKQEVLLCRSGGCNLITCQLSPDWIKGLVVVLLFHVSANPVWDFQSWSKAAAVQKQRLNPEGCQFDSRDSYLNRFYWRKTLTSEWKRQHRAAM